MFSEKDKTKLFITVAARLAKERKAKKLKLNYIEAVSYIIHETTEYVRAGCNLRDAIVFGTGLLLRDDVMDGVAETLLEVSLEATFSDGIRSFTIYNPIR